eukprot:6183316-Pleurochrysis_carterae.AAC.2
MAGASAKARALDEKRGEGDLQQPRAPPPELTTAAALPFHRFDGRRLPCENAVKMRSRCGRDKVEMRG